MVRVLVVEDETNIRDMIALNLRHAGMEVVEAEAPKPPCRCWRRNPAAMPPFWT